MAIRHVVLAVSVSLSLASFATSNSSLRIAGGELSSIKQFPHSVFLKLECNHYPKCCGSILTQNIILTAATCLVYCKKPYYPGIEVTMGSDEEIEGDVRKVVDIITHENFTEFKHSNDLGLGKLDRPIILGTTIKRVILLKTPPVYEPAFVAGWGSINGQQETPTILKHIVQNLVDIEECRKVFGPDLIADGTFCMQGKEDTRTDNGDVGAALMVQGFIQIGVLSWGFKEKSYNKIIYTNISYHYDWIYDNVKRLTCRKS